MNITLETPITTEQLANLDKEAQKFANELFTEHYSEIMQTRDAEEYDMNLECLVSVLAKKHSLITINNLLKLKKCVYFHKVKTILEKM
jgi:hypothetical protein